MSGNPKSHGWYHVTMTGDFYWSRSGSGDNLPDSHCQWTAIPVLSQILCSHPQYSWKYFRSIQNLPSQTPNVAGFPRTSSGIPPESGKYKNLVPNYWCSVYLHKVKYNSLHLPFFQVLHIRHFSNGLYNGFFLPTIAPVKCCCAYNFQQRKAPGLPGCCNAKSDSPLKYFPGNH